MPITIVLGDQLFSPSVYEAMPQPLVMIESWELCTSFKHHQQKISFFLSAMRAARDEYRSAGLEVDYHELDPSQKDYCTQLHAILMRHQTSEIHTFDINDRSFKAKLRHRFPHLTEKPSPGFIATRADFREYTQSVKKPFMKTYYERQRRKLNILMAGDKPLGGQFSFDTDNREALPKSGVVIPKLSQPTHQNVAVDELVRRHFYDHPGSLGGQRYPTTRAEAKRALEVFMSERFSCFGVYEDAMSTQHSFLFHSVLSPLINCGLLTPREVLDAAIATDVPLNSKEGFVRQVLGWREFIRGVDEVYGDVQHSRNFFDHQRRLASCWYDGTTGIEPLDHMIKKAQGNGYLHHIERLMVVGNIMLLAEINPREAYRWFMEMFVDSAEWVMGPNVFGMSQFADGGIFATKPYICASNYILKMSDYTKGEWCEELNALYWSFIDRHRDFFLTQPRLAMMVRTLDKMSSEKRKTFAKRADRLRDRLGHV